MVFIEGWQVIMSATMNVDECDLSRVKALQRFAMTNWYQPVVRTMNNINGADYFLYPQVCTQVITQHNAYW